MVKLTRKDVLGTLIILAALVLWWHTPVMQYNYFDYSVKIAFLSILLILGSALLVRHMKFQPTKKRELPLLNRKMLLKFIVLVGVLIVVFFLINPSATYSLKPPIVIPFTVIPALIVGLLFVGLHYPLFEIGKDKERRAILTLDFITTNLLLLCILMAFSLSPILQGVHITPDRMPFFFILSLIVIVLITLLELILARIGLIRLKNFLDVPNWSVFLAVLILLSLSVFYYNIEFTGPLGWT